MKQISVDFDGTLDRKDVQEYIRALLAMDIEVYVITAREPENGVDIIDNSDLWDVVNDLGIKPFNVWFTSYTDKYEYMKGSAIVLHIDDDSHELKMIWEKTSVIPVNVTKPDWKDRCDLILNVI